MLVASEISRPSPVRPAPTQNSHQIAPPVPPRSASPPTTQPGTMMPTATQETVRPWYKRDGPPSQPERHRASAGRREASGGSVRQIGEERDTRASNHRSGPARWRGQDPATAAADRRAGQLDRGGL